MRKSKAKRLANLEGAVRGLHETVIPAVLEAVGCSIGELHGRMDRLEERTAMTMDLLGFNELRENYNDRATEEAGPRITLDGCEVNAGATLGYGYGDANTPEEPGPCCIEDEGCAECSMAREVRGVTVGATMGPDGELEIPNVVTEMLGWAEGDLVRLRAEDGVIRVTKYVEGEE